MSTGPTRWVAGSGVRRRTLVQGLGLLSGLAVLEAAAGCASVGDGAANGTQIGTGTTMAATSGAGGAPAPGAPAAERVARIGAALRQRAQAYARADRAAWVAAVWADPAASDPEGNGSGEASAREDGGAFDAMRALGVTDLTYGQARIEGAHVVCPVTYRIEGIDTAAAEAVTRWDVEAWPPRRDQTPVCPWEEPDAWAVRGTDAVIAGGAPARSSRTPWPGRRRPWRRYGGCGVAPPRDPRSCCQPPARPSFAGPTRTGTWRTSRP